MTYPPDKRELEKLERIILKKAIEIEGSNEIYESQLLRSRYPTMNQRLCPWKEIRKEIKQGKRLHTEVPKVSRRKTKKTISEPYFKNMSIAQEYNIYPVKKPVFPTPLQFIFIGDEEYQNLQNDIFRDDAKYLFPPNLTSFTLSRYFYIWKNKTSFDKKMKKTIKKKINKNRIISTKCSNKNTPLESKETIYRRKKWLNDDYEISPISLEYYSQKRLKPTKASNRLFQSSLTQSKIGDFNNDKIWKKIINYP